MLKQVQHDIFLFPPLRHSRRGEGVLRFFPDEKKEIEEIEDSCEREAEKHNGIIGQLQDDAHDHRSHACPEIGKGHIGADGWSVRRLRKVNGVSHQSGIKEGIAQSPNHSDQEEHRKVCGKGEKGHGDDLCGQTGEKDFLPFIEIEYLSAQATRKDKGYG